MKFIKKKYLHVTEYLTFDVAHTETRFHDLLYVSRGHLLSLLHLLGQQFILAHFDLLPSSQFLALRNEDRLTYNWQRQSKEFPIGLLHRFERVVGDLQTWRSVGTRWNPGHVYPRVSHVVRVLENRLILGVPERNRSIHVSVGIEDYFVTFKSRIYGSSRASLTRRMARIPLANRRW